MQLKSDSIMVLLGIRMDDANGHSDSFFFPLACLFVYSPALLIDCLFSDFHASSPYVITGSVDQTIKVWECR